MKKLFSVALIFSIVVCFCVQASAQSNAIDLNDEWYMFSFYPKELYDAEIKSEQNEDGTYSIKITDAQEEYSFIAHEIADEYYLLKGFIDEEAALIVRRDELKSASGWVMFNSYDDSKTCVFTETRMVMHGSSVEYVFSDTKLCLVKDDDYEKGDVVILSDDAFIWTTAVEYTVGEQKYQEHIRFMFIRSSFVDE